MDTAFLLLRLIDAGHTITQAETWARTVPAYAEAQPAAVNGFAAAVSGLWTYRTTSTNQGSRHPHLAKIGQRWVEHRLG